ncbi:MAG: hypothetical protein H0V14_00040 [Chitinophagaceae bacterium]|jgi:hypothetical protein|nr:hypothetical protein [Chitinophagaceae bacterium]
MKKLIILLFISILLAWDINAQTAAKSVYAEIGGPGIASLNFDTRFNKTEGGLGGRIGVGGFSIDGSSVVFFPIGINYLLGKDSKNYFELGAGVTPLIASSDFSDDETNFSTTFGHLIIGYRLQPANGGITFRAFICPVFGSGFFVPYYAGISFGYKF